MIEKEEKLHPTRNSISFQSERESAAFRKVTSDTGKQQGETRPPDFWYEN